MAWRPVFIPRSPLPSTFGQYFGLPATVLATALQIAVLLGFMTGVSMLVGHDSLFYALRETGPQALAYAALFGNFAAGQWLMARGEWPFLFAAGIYGARADFAQALFRAHRNRTLEQAIIGAPLVTATALWFHIITLAQMPALIFIIIGLGVGSAYASAIPLLFNELGGKAAIVFCNSVVTLAAVFAFSVSLETHHLAPALLAATAGMALTATLARLAPARLARLDWPIETEPANA